MTYYAIDTGEGNELCSGLSASQVRVAAQRAADERGEPVYYYSAGTDGDAPVPSVRVDPTPAPLGCGWAVLWDVDGSSADLSVASKHRTQAAAERALATADRAMAERYPSSGGTRVLGSHILGVWERGAYRPVTSDE